MPRVSVVIPTYNRVALIRDALESVFAQTYRDFEVVVVDDGSTDNTRDVLSAYGEQICVVSQTNQGEASARNAGIREARGDFVAFLNSDDLWISTKLERQMSLLDANPDLVWAYSDAESFDGDTGRSLYLFSQLVRLNQGKVLSHLFINNFIASPTPIIRRDVFSQVGDFWHSPKGTDWDMWLRIARLHAIGLVNQPLARYRVHRGMVTSNQSYILMYQAFMDVIHRAIVRDPEILIPLKNQSMACQFIGIGRLMARNGDRAEARRMFLQAIRLEPNCREAYLYWISCMVGESALHFATQLRRRLRRKNS